MTEDEFINNAFEDGVPEHLIGPIARYVYHGLQPGGFLVAVFSGSLFGAYTKGDEESLKGMGEIVKFIYRYCPSYCAGNQENVENWIGSGGLASKKN